MYEVKQGQNGRKFVDVASVKPVFHASTGNTKTGPAGNYNLPIEYTCRHDCECYKLGKCYACQGCYLFASNQALYSENYRYYKENTAETLAATIVDFIDANNLHLFRYFTCGDIPGAKFLDAVVLAAIARPDVKYWLYTKKYHIVNKYLADNGADVIPDNVSIIFSHWMNDDGTYFPMPNPYGFQTSEFIPLGHEDMAEHVTHICPCSDPTVKATCATCSHPCYDLKRGESMALLEHSTQRTKERDRAIKAAKAAL